DRTAAADRIRRAGEVPGSRKTGEVVPPAAGLRSRRIDEVEKRAIRVQPEPDVLRLDVLVLRAGDDEPVRLPKPDRNACLGTISGGVGVFAEAVAELRRTNHAAAEQVEARRAAGGRVELRTRDDRLMLDAEVVRDRVAEERDAADADVVEPHAALQIEAGHDSESG